jgi:hypothetical protein
VDVDGHTISNTAWNGTHSTLRAAPYDLDGDPSTFSQTELTAIAHIWHRIAEDFAGHDVNVTTEEPSQLNATTGRILITKNTDTTGKTMPYAGAGGVAYVGVWGRSNYHTYYSPALVYYDNLGNGNVHYTAEAASHEMGHNLGLGHDGKTDGTGYYGGHGSGNTDWGPIMGVGYYGQVTQWSKGDYAQANNTQDDIAIITNKLSTRTYDHGDNLANASLLVIDADGSIGSTNPENDPNNLQTDNKGIIEKAGDVDYFMLELDQGPVSLTITPAWAAFYSSGRRGSNLDIYAELTNGAGQVLAQSDNPDDTVATLSTNVNAGTYYLAVTNESTGDPETGYNDYGSLGQYYISGNAVPGTGDNNAPEDNLPPNAQNDNVSLAEDTQVEFSVLSNDTDPEETPLSISEFTQPNNGTLFLNNGRFTYVPNSDFSGFDNFNYNITDAGGATDSATVQLTITPVNDAPQALPDTATTEMDTPISIDVLVNDSDADGDTLTLVLGNGPTNGSVQINATALVYTPNTNFIGTDSFTYVIADSADATATATVSITVTEKLTPPTTPTGFSTSDDGLGAALLRWSDTANETRYEIQRELFKTKGKSGWTSTTLLSTAENTTQRLDSVSNGTYRYRIRSNNALGSSNWSAWQTVDISSNQSTGGGGKGRKK